MLYAGYRPNLAINIIAFVRVSNPRPDLIYISLTVSSHGYDRSLIADIPDCIFLNIDSLRSDLYRYMDPYVSHQSRLTIHAYILQSGQEYTLKQTSDLF